jgi:hypothetical protein
MLAHLFLLFSVLCFYFTKPGRKTRGKEKRKKKGKKSISHLADQQISRLATACPSAQLLCPTKG